MIKKLTTIISTALGVAGLEKEYLISNCLNKYLVAAGMSTSYHIQHGLRSACFAGTVLTRHSLVNIIDTIIASLSLHSINAFGWTINTLFLERSFPAGQDVVSAIERVGSKSGRELECKVSSRCVDQASAARVNYSMRVSACSFCRRLRK